MTFWPCKREFACLINFCFFCIRFFFFIPSGLYVYSSYVKIQLKKQNFLVLVLVPVSRLSFFVFSSSRNTCKRKLAKLYMYEEP